MGKSVDNLRDVSLELQRRLEGSTSLAHRKRCGQFFTPRPICQFMARLLAHPHKKQYKLLDPGAGVGSLTAAVCEEFSHVKSLQKLEVHLFETDPRARYFLEENMILCRRSFESTGHVMEYYIHGTDFIVALGEEFSKSKDLFPPEIAIGHFDGVIMNPPYFKIGKNSLHARLMASIVHGQPNIYALFMALAAHALHPGGQLVGITPRSFCNGLYFRDFRQWFLRRMSIEHLHLFESRTETFEEGILQESIITLARRSDKQASTIKVSTSIGAGIQAPATHQLVPASKVIDSPRNGYLIRIPTNNRDTEIMNMIESLPVCFAETGLRISTGPVVLFRAKEFLLEKMESKGAVPLFLPHNVKPFETVWPLQKPRKPIAFKACAASRRLLLPANNYVLVKRFSAKEERRRLTAGCFFGAWQSYEYVALENHLNYIYHGSRELSENEVYGIAALMNSALYDRYFRLMSGSTQVNATELRTLKFPPLDVIELLGNRVGESLPFNETVVEDIVLDTLDSLASVSSVPTESLA